MTDVSGATRVPTRGGSFEEGLANGQKLLDGNPAVALHQAETLLRLGPEPRALQLAAAALRHLGRDDEAEESELSAIKASFAIRELDDAAVAAHDGRVDESRETIAGFLDKQPGNLLAQTMAAELEIDEWRLEPAEQRLRTVLERAPKFLRAIMLLAKCLTNQARLREAAAVVEEIVQRKPDNVTALRNLGQLYAEGNQQEKAVEVEAHLLKVEPRLIDMWIIYAQHLRMLGRKEESKTAFRSALAIDPNSGAAWWGLTNYFTADISNADIEAMEQALASRSDSPQDGGPLNIALSITAERRGDYAATFRYVAEGKRLRAQADPYDAPAASRKVNELIETFTGHRLADCESAGCPDDSPIFIVGMPRSGTTLIERILSRHSHIEAGGELPIMPRLEERLRHTGENSYPERIGSLDADEVTQLGNWYVDRSREYRMSSKPRFIDKLNLNWSRAGLIRMMLPNARILDVRRNALDCCWSNFKMLFAEGHLAANDQRDIARFYRDYFRTMEAIDAALPGGILHIQYEALVDDVEGETRRILDFLGLEYESTCIDFYRSTGAVATPSSEQVRRPINRDSIGSALPYRQWLGPMIDELGDLAR